MNTHKSAILRAASLILLLLAPLSVAAETQDYLLVFGADSQPYRPTKAHVFAAVVRVVKDPSQPPRLLELTSLSWLPETMKVRAFALRPEKGRSVPLEETLQAYQARGSRICLWGPYRIQPELAETFKARVRAVENGFAYKATTLFAPRHVCDCARAVEETVETRRRYIGTFGYGAAAASVVVRKFSPWLVEPAEPHPWVETLIGLDPSSLVHRPYGDFTSRLDQLGGRQ